MISLHNTLLHVPNVTFIIRGCLRTPVGYLRKKCGNKYPRKVAFFYDYCGRLMIRGRQKTSRAESRCYAHACQEYECACVRVCAC